MSVDDPLVCCECEALVSDKYDALTIVLNKHHITCAAELINLGESVYPSHVRQMFEFDIVQLVEQMMKCYGSCEDITNLWLLAISENSFMIMTFLESFNQPLHDDIRHAILANNTLSVKFLITNLNRVPNYDDVFLVVEIDAYDILKVLCDYAETNSTFKKTMWDADTITLAIQSGKLQCVKIIIDCGFDITLWNPGIINDVCTHLNKWEYDEYTDEYTPQAVIDNYECLRESLFPLVLECVRYVYDSSVPLTFDSCPILFDNCYLVNCGLCLTTNTSFIMLRQLLAEYLGGRYLDIVKLLVLFSCTFQQCKTCGTFETFDTRIHYVCCNSCNTTYYCHEGCRLKGWEIEHKNTCGKYYRMR